MNCNNKIAQLTLIGELSFRTLEPVSEAEEGVVDCVCPPKPFGVDDAVCACLAFCCARSSAFFRSFNSSIDNPVLSNMVNLIEDAHTKQD